MKRTECIGCRYYTTQAQGGHAFCLRYMEWIVGVEVCYQFEPMPITEQQMQRVGRWNVFSRPIYICSSCDYQTDKSNWNFCPRCGAYMQGMKPKPLSSETAYERREKPRTIFGKKEVEENEEDNTGR